MSKLTTIHQPGYTKGAAMRTTVYYTQYDHTGKAFRRQRTFTDDAEAADFIDTERAYGSRITKIEQHW